jgi:hypothetical protein
MVSPVRGDYRRCQAETPLIDLFKLADPALLTQIMPPVARVAVLFNPATAQQAGLMLRAIENPPHLSRWRSDLRQFKTVPRSRR